MHKYYLNVRGARLMDAHDIAQQLVSDFGPKDHNEADTRHQLINPLLHDVLNWPRSRVKCEEFIRPGYADYVLNRADGSPLLFIEAKRTGHYFSIPEGLAPNGLSAYVKVKTLLTDADTAAAINQVRDYCLTRGCEFAAVTNGHQWVFFKTFQISQDWREIRALVVRRLEHFSQNFIQAHNTFSYNAITEKASLRRLFHDGTVANRELFYPKDKITAYDANVDANGYASSLRPIAEKYFGVIDVTDARFMEHCYVSDREFDLAFTNARRRLEDAITPFLDQYGIRDFHDSERGGGFGKRITKNITGPRPADVVVLFGGKGVGKSTFLRRLLFHKPPQAIQKQGVVAIIDLLNVRPDPDEIQRAIWDGIIGTLDQDHLLTGSRDGLCSLFSDRFDQAKKQDLFGLDENSEVYNVRLNGLVAEWKRDHVYVAKCLATRVRSRHKAVIVNIDNTDQYEERLQELCFSIGQSIASSFPCVVIISMREERFFSSSIRGTLDAYQNSGFHITPPQPREVFLKRISYVVELITTDDDSDNTLPSRIDRDAVSSLFRILAENFRDTKSHLANFLTACSHGNIRLALELFRGFVVSGYTNVREMTAGRGWTLQIHQVIKPFMIPSRFFYSENLSRIPNIFQVRSKSHGSHFTALRILALLLEGHDSKTPPFVPVAQLSLPFIDEFAMREDFIMNMDMLLKHHLIESNNRLDLFAEDVDSVKITTYGVFMLRALSHAFTYLELTAEDCAIADPGAANEIAELSNDEYRFYTRFMAMERVEVRLKRADAFLRYLTSEEGRENAVYHPAVETNFTRSMRNSFERERIAVMRSARRNVPNKEYL